MAFALGRWLRDQVSLRFGACIKPRASFSARPVESSSLFASGVVSALFSRMAVLASFTRSRDEVAKAARWTTETRCGSCSADLTARRGNMLIVVVFLCMPIGSFGASLAGQLPSSSSSDSIGIAARSIRQCRSRQANGSSAAGVRALQLGKPKTHNFRYVLQA